MNAQLQIGRTTLDAPIEGWDAFHSLDNMPPSAAVILDNLIPSAGDVETRKGTQQHVDLGTASPVDTLASVDNGVNSKLLAASGGGIWEVSNPESVVEVAAAATYGSNRWQTENFKKADESGILIMCNGTDDAQIYGPSDDSITAMVDGGTDADGTVWPAVGTDFIGCLSFKGRMYYWKDNDNSFYYSQAGSYQGILKEFDLGSFTQQGGKLVFAASWTQQDSGDGKDDFIVFVFSTGEILLYQGDDPETAGYWEMVGRYFTAEPMSIRGHTNYGSDLIIMTKDGYVALSTIIQQGRTSDVPQFSRLIHNAITRRTNTLNASDLFGWEVELFQKEGLMIFNVPISSQTNEQHVMNTVTNRWCRFTNIYINTLEVHNERLYAGNRGGVVLAMLEGTSDEGLQIDFTCLYAFNYFGQPGLQKHLTAAQIISTHRTPGDITLQGYSDYRLPDIAPVFAPTAESLGTWSIEPAVPAQDVGSLWDTDFWAIGDEEVSTRGWQNVSAYGFAVSLLVRFALVNNSIKWRSTNLWYYVAGAQ